jgi:hypothetical protein
MFLKLHYKFSVEFFFFNDNGMFFKEVKILVIRLLDFSIVGFKINGYGYGDGYGHLPSKPKTFGIGWGCHPRR